MHAPRPLLSVVVVLALLGGCGARLGHVSGKLTFQGKPVAAADLAFTRIDKGDDEFFGVSGEDGIYQVSYRTVGGMPPGRYRIQVTRYVFADGSPVPSGESGEVARAAGRTVKETFILERDIVARENNLDLEMSDGKKPGY